MLFFLRSVCWAVGRSPDGGNAIMVAAYLQRHEDLENFKEMMNKANRWHTSNNLRNYISEMEARSLTKENLPAELFNWLQWARDKADWYDSFIEKKI